MRLAVLERWLPNAVTILGRFHCMILVVSIVQAICGNDFLF